MENNLKKYRYNGKTVSASSAKAAALLLCPEKFSKKVTAADDDKKPENKVVLVSKNLRPFLRRMSQYQKTTLTKWLRYVGIGGSAENTSFLDDGFFVMMDNNGMVFLLMVIDGTYVTAIPSGDNVLPFQKQTYIAKDRLRNLFNKVPLRKGVLMQSSMLASVLKNAFDDSSLLRQVSPSILAGGVKAARKESKLPSAGADRAD